MGDPMELTTTKWALAAGLKPKMAYSIAETAKYTGLSVATLYKMIKIGAINAIIPSGLERGLVIRTDEMERWFEEQDS